jgi:hypothetical protein
MQAIIPNFLDLPARNLLEKFGAGQHKPGSGSASALLGLVACKMMRTVILATERSPRYEKNLSQLRFVASALTEQHEPFFQEAFQKDLIQFDRYHQARIARNNCKDAIEKRRLADKAREELMPATEIPLEIGGFSCKRRFRGGNFSCTFIMLRGIIRSVLEFASIPGRALGCKNAGISRFDHGKISSIAGRTISARLSDSSRRYRCPPRRTPT